MNKLKSIKIVGLITIGLVLVSCSNETKNKKNPTPLQKYENAVSKLKNEEVFNYKLLNDSLREIYDNEYRTKESERIDEMGLNEWADSLIKLDQFNEHSESYFDYMDEVEAISDEVQEKYYPPILFESYADFNPVKALASTTWVYPTKENPIGEIKFHSDGSFEHITDLGYPILATYPIPGSEEIILHPSYGGFQRETWGNWEVDLEGNITLTYSIEDAEDWGWIYELEDEYGRSSTPKEFVQTLNFDEVRHKDGYMTPVPIKLETPYGLATYNTRFPQSNRSFFYESTHEEWLEKLYRTREMVDLYGSQWVRENVDLDINGFHVVTEEENLYFPDWSGMVYNHIENLGKTITFWDGRTGKNLYKGIFLNHSTGTTHAFGVWVDRNGNIIKVEVK